MAWEALEGHVLPSLAGQACLHPPPGLLWAVWGLRDWLEASGEGAVLCFIPMTLKVSLGSAAQGQVIFWNLKGDEWNLGSQMHSKWPQTAVIMAVCCPALVTGGTGECGLIAYHSPCEPDFTSGFNRHLTPWTSGSTTGPWVSTAALDDTWAGMVQWHTSLCLGSLGLSKDVLNTGQPGWIS